MEDASSFAGQTPGQTFAAAVALATASTRTATTAQVNDRFHSFKVSEVASPAHMLGTVDKR